MEISSSQQAMAQAVMDRLIYVMDFNPGNGEVVVYRDPENNNEMVTDVARYAIEQAQLSESEFPLDEQAQPATESSTDYASDTYPVTRAQGLRSRYVRPTQSNLHRALTGNRVVPLPYIGQGLIVSVIWNPAAGDWSFGDFADVLQDAYGQEETDVPDRPTHKDDS
ncbi:MAG: hypothetical protein V4492_05985 [Chlamydiota bacterium]